jgi:hypothetical protein
MQTFRAILLAIILVLLVPDMATAQTTTAPRIQSRNGAWLLPVAGHVLCSDEQRHIGRGSVRAWDLCVGYGSAIYPLADGRVIYAGCNNAGGYGCWVMIDYGDGYKSIYGHMINGSIRVKNGEHVKQGEIIGQVGWTGLTSFGPHTHFELSRNGSRLMIGDFFDRSLLQDCPLCNSPKGAVVASGRVGRVNAYLTGNNPLLAFLGLSAYFLGWFLWDHKRVWLATVHNAFVVVLVANLPAVLAILIAVSPGAVGPSLGPMSTDAQWNFVYGFMGRWEGAKCTTDPVRTFKGVTQGTYNRYRMEMGMGPGDVCTSLTERQAADIYYRYYYLASGANTLQPAIALHHFDFAVNAGVGAATRAYGQCGNDFNCYTRYRVAFYKSASLCQIYCPGWLNRVNDLQRYVMKASGHADEL